MPKLVRLIACVFVLAWAAPTAAQSPQESKELGELRIIVFVEAQPAPGVSVDVPGLGTAVTNENGAVVLTGPDETVTPILQIPVRLLSKVATDTDTVRVQLPQTTIVANHTVEVIATLDSSGNLVTSDIEKPDDATVVADTASQTPDKNAPLGTVRGIVVSKESQRPVFGAGIFVRGHNQEVETDAQGNFSVTVPEGVHEIVVIHAKYATTRRKGVAVTADTPTTLRIELEAASLVLEDFVVTAPHIEGGIAALVAERRKSSSVDEVIGAEEMSRSGDSDAAGALRRVTGITVIGGQFVYVRGMGERYSSTLLNGQFIPSPEPERRVIPLDLFSTDVLESVVIQKTPSPDSPGEFGGGVVLLRTKTFPEDFTLGASVSTGLASNTTFQKRPSHKGGRLDFLGTDDGTRTLPDEIRDNSPLREGNRFQQGLSPEELARMGRLLQANYNVTNRTTAPDSSFGLHIGDSFEVKNRPAGFLAYLGHGRDHRFRDEVNRRFVSSTTAEGGLELNNDFRTQELAQTVSASAILAAGIEPKKGDAIHSTTLLLRITDNETALVTGRSDDLGKDIRRSRLRFVERQLFTQQLSGSHELEHANKGLLQWRYSYSRALRDEPDRREYFYSDESPNPDDGNPDFQISARPAGNQRVWSELTDSVHDAGMDYTQPFSVWKNLEAHAKVGAIAVFRKRSYNTLRLTLRAPRELSPEERRLSPNELWNPSKLNADAGWILEDNTQPTDAYSANQEIQAGYAMMTLPATERLELSTGLRVERSRQRVTTFSPFDIAENPLQTELDNTDFLPSAVAKLQLSDELVLRTSYGRTVTRPDFRELSESSFRDVVTATRFVGNPELVRGTIDNVDARLEYYFSTDELASIGAFYKRFDDPIEQVDLGGVDRSVSWDNAESATNIGIEIEARRRMGFLSSVIDAVFASVNVALIRSRVNLGEEATGVSTSQKRALQGQSPYVVNLQLGYEDPENTGITAVFLYNLFGKRIRDVGRLGSPDIFEAPLHQLDFVYDHEFADNWKVKFKAKNLLNQEVRFTQGTKVARRYRTGRTFSLSGAWSW